MVLCRVWFVVHDIIGSGYIAHQHTHSPLTKQRMPRSVPEYDSGLEPSGHSNGGGFLLLKRALGTALQSFPEAHFSK